MHERNVVASQPHWWVSPQCCLGELKHNYALQAIRQAASLRPCSPLGLACSAQPAHNKALEAASGSCSQEVFANLRKAVVTACMTFTSGNPQIQPCIPDRLPRGPPRVRLLHHTRPCLLRKQAARWRQRFPSSALHLFSV